MVKSEPLIKSESKNEPLLKEEPLISPTKSKVLVTRLLTSCSNVSFLIYSSIIWVLISLIESPCLKNSDSGESRYIKY